MPKNTKAIKISDLIANKPWLKKINDYKYSENTINTRKRFLIICEGQTEEMYFKSFPVLADIKTISKGSTKSKLVETVKHYTEDEEYDEIWCVFDMDYNPKITNQQEDFNSAIKKAIILEYKCAYSNDAFELWFVLHYKYLDQKELRTEYFKILSKYWNINYEKDGKSKKFSRIVYNKLVNDPKSEQKEAIRNAKKLHESQMNQSYHDQNPVTTVYLLVDELNLHLRK